MNFSAYRASVHATYFKTARQHAERYHALDRELEELRSRGVAEEELSQIQERIGSCYEERTQAAIVAITLAGMALEAFFYDYAAESLGDAFVRQHLDKLDLKSKFLIYPQLVCGSQPAKSEAAYFKLDRLAGLRNELVHFKSKPFDLNELDRAAEFHENLNDRLKTGVDDAIDCVSRVMAQLDRLHGGQATYRLLMGLLVC